MQVTDPRYQADMPLAELTEAFDTLQSELFAYQYAESVITYDGETVSPPNGVYPRSEAMGTLAGIEHDLAYGEPTGELLEALAPHAAELDELHSDELRVFARDYDETHAIPTQECADFARLVSSAVVAWKQAKATSDYTIFEPYLSDIIASLKRQAAYLDPDRDSYEVWLDRFERGLTRETLDTFFDTVQEAVVPLVHEIADAGRQPDASFLVGDVDVATQKEVCRRVSLLMGLDPDALSVGDTEHPFTIEFSHNDVRIANHIYVDNVASALFSFIHEGGHALYEQNIDPRYDYTCLRGGVSMGIHESQSRFMENVIARSEAFCTQLLPILCSCIPGMFDRVDAGMLYRALCRCEPGLIRTEADELTYPLHILVRYKIESALFAGEVSVHDAPHMWNELMKRYLGVDVPDDAHGILQDTHWANGSLAYFPSYAIGSAYATQFLRAMERDMDVFACVAEGDMTPVNAWLREHIWRFGSSQDPSWIFENACGEPFDPTCYTDYLTKKYRAIYGL